MMMTRMIAMSLALVLLATTSGCVPAYLVRPNELQQDEVPSVRERDGQSVTLQGGSFRVTRDPPLPDGRVRVRGPGRHGKTWLAGLTITVAGVALGLTALGLGVLSATPGVGYSGSASDGTGNTTSSGHALGISAIVVGSAGLLAGGLIGPSIWIAAARQAPIELRF